MYQYVQQIPFWLRSAVRREACGASTHSPTAGEGKALCLAFLHLQSPFSLRVGWVFLCGVLFSFWCFFFSCFVWFGGFVWLVLLYCLVLVLCFCFLVQGASINHGQSSEPNSPLCMVEEPLLSLQPTQVPSSPAARPTQGRGRCPPQKAAPTALTSSPAWDLLG